MYKDVLINSIEEMTGGEYFLMGGFYSFSNSSMSMTLPLMMITRVQNGHVLWNGIAGLNQYPLQEG